MKKKNHMFKIISIIMIVFFVVNFPSKDLLAEPVYDYKQKPVTNNMNIEYDSNTGGLSHSYNLSFPSGRNGLEPNLSLNYSSGNSNISGYFGHGWDIDIPYIERINRKGVDKLYDEDYFYSSLGGEIVNIEGSEVLEMEQMSQMSILDNFSIASYSKSSEMVDGDSNLMGSVSGNKALKEKKEKKEKRSFNSKTYEVGLTKNGDKIYTSDVYGSAIHYYNQETGTFDEIDTRLEDKISHWEMNKAAYKMKIDKYTGNNFISFENQEQELKFDFVKNSKLLKESKKNILGVQSFEDDELSQKKVRYSNYPVDDIDMEISLFKDGFAKEIVINSKKAIKEYVGDKYFEVPFLLSSNKKIDLKIDGELLSEQKLIISNREAEIFDQDGISSFIMSPIAEDASLEIIDIDIRYELRNGKIYLTKLIPIEWLESATYPVRSDATIWIYNYSNIDGYVSNASSTWDGTHDATSGNGRDYNPQMDEVRVERTSSQYKMKRFFLPFDTSILPNNTFVTQSLLYIYILFRTNDVNDGNDFVTVVQTSQESPASLFLDDYDQCGYTHGPIEGIDESRRFDITTIGTGWQYFVLNDEGKSWIDDNDWTKLGLREGHDFLDNNNFDIDESNSLKFYTANVNGNYRDPHLSVTYIIFNPDQIPTNLKAGNEVEPTALFDTTPDFTAEYNDSN